MSELDKVNDSLDKWSEGYFDSYSAALANIRRALELHGITFPADSVIPMDFELVYKIEKDNLPKDLHLYIAINPSDDYDHAFEAYAQIVDKEELDALYNEDDEDEDDDISVATPSFSSFLRQTRRTSDD